MSLVGICAAMVFLFLGHSAKFASRRLQHFHDAFTETADDIRIFVVVVL